MMFKNISKPIQRKIFNYDSSMDVFNDDFWSRAIITYDIDYCTETNLYQYHQNHPECHYLAEIIEKNKKKYSTKCEEFIYQCYYDLLARNDIGIINDIIQNYNSVDGVALYLVAVDNLRYDLLSLMVSNNFSVNQNIFAIGYNTYYVDTLSYAITSKNLDLIKYLLDNGADPLQNNKNPLNFAYKYSLEIFEYLIELHKEDNILVDLFYQIITDTFFKEKEFGILVGKINNINLVWEKPDIYHFLKIVHLKYLINNGLNIDNHHYKMAYQSKNKELVYFLISEKLVNIEIDDIILAVKDTSLDILITLAEQGYDMSQIPDTDKEFMDKINNLEKAGLQKETLLGYYIKNLYHVK